MVIGIILSLMLLACFLVSYILLEKWDKQCEEKNQIKKQERKRPFIQK